MFADPENSYDWSGLSHDAIHNTVEGYLILIRREASSGEIFNLYLSKHGANGGGRVNLDSTSIAFDLDTFHHINISRIDRTIKVYFDGVLKLEVDESIHQAIETSEQFVFFSWSGRFKLDNISVSDFTPETTTTTSTEPTPAANGFLVLISGLALVTLVLVRNKRKKY